MNPLDETQKLETAQPTVPIIPERVKEAMGDEAGATADEQTTSPHSDENASEPVSAGKKRILIAVAAVVLVALIGVGLVAGGVFSSPGESVAPVNDKVNAAVQGDQAAKAEAEEPADAVEEEAGETSAEEAEAAAEEAAASKESVPSSSSSTTSSATTSESSSTSSSSSSASSSSSGSSASSESSSTSEPVVAPEPAKVSVSVYIDSSAASSEGYPSCLGSGTVSLAEGASVYDALNALGVSVGGSSSYVTSISGLSEFACGPLSGWKYSVNGSFPNSSCGDYKLKSGDSVKWVYVLQP